jgi:hypothetical protein
MARRSCVLVGLSERRRERSETAHPRLTVLRYNGRVRRGRVRSWLHRLRAVDRAEWLACIAAASFAAGVVGLLTARGAALAGEIALWNGAFIVSAVAILTSSLTSSEWWVGSGARSPRRPRRHVRSCELRSGPARRARHVSGLLERRRPDCAPSAGCSLGKSSRGLGGRRRHGWRGGARRSIDLPRLNLRGGRTRGSS